MPESLKQIRQRLRDLRARTGNAVVELGGSEPAEGVPQAGGLYHIDRAVADLTEHIDAGYNTPDDLGAEPAPEPEPEPTPGVDEVLSVTELDTTVEVVVGYDADAAARVDVSAWRGPDLPNINLTNPPNPATLSIPRGQTDVETRIAVVRRDASGGFVSEEVLETIIVPALADGGTEAVADLIVSPDVLDLEVGETADLDAQVVGTSGAVLTRPVTWTSDDPSVATVDADGLVTAVAEGTVVVWAESEGVRDPTDVSVVAVGSDPAPTPDPDPSGALVVDDPDSFSSSAEVRANGYDRTSIIHLDTQVARPGGTQSIRYDFVDQGVNNAIHAGRRLRFPARVREVWIETQLRWSANYFAIQNFPQDGSTFAHKLLFGAARTQNAESWLTTEGFPVGRWSFILPGGGSANPPHARPLGESPVLDNGAANIMEFNHLDAADYFDETWRTFRLHWRSDPGLYELWIDGVKVIERSGFTVHPEVALVGLALGRNKDDGIESGTESLWWGRTWASTEDPGW